VIDGAEKLQPHFMIRPDHLAAVARVEIIVQTNWTLFHPLEELKACLYVSSLHHDLVRSQDVCILALTHVGMGLEPLYQAELPRHRCRR
jgi:hypothetical protein